MMLFEPFEFSGVRLKNRVVSVDTILDEVVKSRKRLMIVIPAPYRVRGKLHPESSNLR